MGKNILTVRVRFVSGHDHTSDRDGASLLVVGFLFISGLCIWLIRYMFIEPLANCCY